MGGLTWISPSLLSVLACLTDPPPTLPPTMRSAFLRCAARSDEREDDVDERDAERAGEGLTRDAAVRVRPVPRRSCVGTRIVVGSEGRDEGEEQGRPAELQKFRKSRSPAVLTLRRGL